VGLLVAFGLFEWKSNQSTTTAASTANGTPATLSSLGSLVSQIASSLSKGGGGGGIGGGSGGGSSSGGGFASSTSPGAANSTAQQSDSVDLAEQGLDPSGNPIVETTEDPTITDTLSSISDPGYSTPAMSYDPTSDDGSGDSGDGGDDFDDFGD
jgi:hypothetical protein